MSERAHVFITEGPGETRAMAEAMARTCRPGDVIGLCGTLGAGKTVFVKGLAAGLGVGDVRRVTSPTFILMRDYPGRLTLHHFDAYRLEDAAEMQAIGCDETFEGDGVSVVEWADHVSDCLPAEHFLLTIRVEGETKRRLRLCAVGRGPADRLGEVVEALAQWAVRAPGAPSL